MIRITQILCLQLLIFATSSSFSQAIDSMVVTPSSIVGVNDTVKVLVYNTFNYGSCVGSANYSKNGFNVNASALHCQGVLTVICHDVDTIVLDPPHVVGNYMVSFVLSSGFGFPTCSPGIVPDDFDTAYFSVSTNAPPIISPITSKLICENTILGPLPFTISDEDVNTVIATATSDNQTLVNNSNITLAGNGSSRTIQVMPSTFQTGSAIIKIAIEDNVGQKDSTSFELQVVICTNIEDHSDSDVEIYPNPSEGEIKIELQKVYSKLDLDLFNMKGQKLKSWTFVNVKNIQLQLDQEPGLYVLKLSSSELNSTQYIQLK